MTSEPDDSDLVRDVAGGNQGALAQLVARHAAGVRALAFRFTGNAADAEDVAQDVFLKVWTHGKSFDAGRGSFTTWLYRVTANRCFDLVRSRRRWSWIGLDAAGEQPSAAAPADQLLDERETLAAVRKDILELPERQRMALLLVAMGERSAQNVADVLGISRGSAEQLIVRARQTLRDRQRTRTKL